MRKNGFQKKKFMKVFFINKNHTTWAILEISYYVFVNSVDTNYNPFNTITSDVMYGHVAEESNFDMERSVK